MISRLLRLTSFLVISFLFLSACGPVTAVPTLEPSATRTPGATKPVIPATSTATRLPSINVSAESLYGARIQVWYALSGASEQAFLSLMARFNSVNEWGITVDAVSQGDYQTLGEAVGSSLIQASAQPASPDLVIALPEQVLVWNASGVVVGLDPYIADSKWGLTENGGADDFVPTFWDQNRVNGRMLAVPAEYSGRYLFYNVTWAHELGFDHPPVTSDDFRQQACAANGSFRKDADPSDDGYGGWIVDTNWQSIYPLLLAYGSGMMDGDQVHFHTDANVAALTFLKKLKDDGCAWMAIDPENPPALNTGPFYEQFARRSALFITGDLTEVSALNDTMARLNNADEWTVTPLPGPEGGGVAVYGSSYTLLTTTLEKQLAAWVFVRWMLSAENQGKWVEKTGTLPLRISVLDQVADYRSTHPQWAEAVNLLPFIVGVPQLASWGTLRYVLQDGATEIFRMNLPPDQIPAVLDEMDATANELFNK